MPTTVPQDLHSDCPCLRLDDGTVLQGEYEEPLGSVMLFQRITDIQVGSSGDPGTFRAVGVFNCDRASGSPSIH